MFSLGRLFILLVALGCVIAPTSRAQQIADLSTDVLPNHEVQLNNADATATPNRLPATKSGPPIAPTNQLLPESATTRLSTVTFDKVPLAEAMQTLSKQVGINVITSTDAGDRPITVYLEKVSAIDAIDAIVKANGLFYRVEEQSGIIRIACLLYTSPSPRD